jgi:hypothetical protein
MNKKNLVIAALGLAVIGMTGCATAAPKAQAAREEQRQRTEANSEIDADRTRIANWLNKDLQLPARPQWLIDLAQGNDGTIKAQFNLDDLGNDAVVKLIVVQSPNLNTAQARALTDLAAKISTELKTTVNMETADSLSDDQQTTTQTIVMKANFDVSGMRQITDFWQLVENENSAGRKTQQYVYYRVYAIGRASWQTLVAAYMRSILEELQKDQSNESAVQAIARQFQQIEEASARNDAWNADQIEYQRRVAEGVREDANTARDQQFQRDMQGDRLESANLRTTEETARAATAASAASEQTAISPKQQKAIAASVSSSDIDWIGALGTAAKIIL